MRRLRMLLILPLLGVSACQGVSYSLTYPHACTPHAYEAGYCEDYGAPAPRYR